MKIVKLQQNDYKVLELLLKYKSLNRTFLYKKLEISPAGITKIVKKLMNFNLLAEDIGEKANNNGRTNLILNKDFGYIIGVNLGAGFLNIVLANFTGEIITYKSKKISYRSNVKMINMLENEILQAIEENSDKHILAIGVSLNGIVDNKKGISIFSPHIKLEDFNIKEYLEYKIKKPIFVENDVRAMLIAEQLYGNYRKPLQNVALLYIKNGIGSAILINGEIYTGVNFKAGEIGHYVYDTKSNNLCKCGKYGCLETEFSDVAILEKINWELQLKGSDKTIETIDEVYEYALKKQEPYYSIVSNAAQEMGRIVGNVYKMLDIGSIIIAGEIAYSGDEFMKDFQKGMSMTSTDKIDNDIELKVSKLGRNIENYGCIAIVLNNLFVNDKLIKI